MLKSIIFYISTILCAATAFAQQPAMDDLKQQTQTARQEIQKTSQKIKQNKNKTLKSLNDLNRITAEINEKQKDIDEINRQIIDINVKIQNVNRHIAARDSALRVLRENYLKAIKKIRSHNATANNSKMMFLFSSESFHQAYRRLRYLKEFSRWREGQTKQIKNAMAELEKQKQQLQALQKEKNEAYNTINSTKLALEGQKNEQNRMIAALKTEQGNLLQILHEQQRKLDELDRQLNALIEAERRKAEEEARIEAERRKAEEAERARIAEERRKAEEERIRKEQEEKEAELQKIKQQQQQEKEKKEKEELKRRRQEIEQRQEELRKEKERLENEREEARKKEKERREAGYPDENEIKLTGSFESNKGKLPYPVTGSFRVVKPFGKHKHPVLEYVTTDNPGIEIETDAGAMARSVFDGTVSYVYQVNNEYNYVVILKHGEYITVYAGLETIAVKKGDSVKAGQALGSLFTDVNDDDHAMLHFQVRKGSTKLNPQEWLK